MTAPELGLDDSLLASVRRRAEREGLTVEAVLADLLEARERAGSLRSEAVRRLLALSERAEAEGWGGDRDRSAGEAVRDDAAPEAPVEGTPVLRRGFVDSGIWSALFDAGRPAERAVARRLLKAHGASRELWLSTRVLEEVHDRLAAFPRAPGPDEREAILGHLARLPTVVVDRPLVLAAAARTARRPLRDRLVAEAAVQARCVEILTDRPRPVALALAADPAAGADAPRVVDPFAGGEEAQL